VEVDSREKEWDNYKDEGSWYEKRYLLGIEWGS
jgi:hypothetical protein